MGLAPTPASRGIDTADCRKSLYPPLLKAISIPYSSAIFHSQLRVAIYFKMKLCQRCRCCVRGGRDRDWGNDGDEKEEQEEAEGFFLLPSSSNVHLVGNRLIMEASPNGIHKAQFAWWKLVSTERGWKSVVFWRCFLECWALLKTLTWIATEHLWK